jgi:hypothetical protein
MWSGTVATPATPVNEIGNGGRGWGSIFSLLLPFCCYRSLINAWCGGKGTDDVRGRGGGPQLAPCEGVTAACGSGGGPAVHGSGVGEPWVSACPVSIERWVEEEPNSRTEGAQRGRSRTVACWWWRRSRTCDVLMVE